MLQKAKLYYGLKTFFLIQIKHTISSSAYMKGRLLGKMTSKSIFNDTFIILQEKFRAHQQELAPSSAIADVNQSNLN